MFPGNFLGHVLLARYYHNVCRIGSMEKWKLEKIKKWSIWQYGECYFELFECTDIPTSWASMVKIDADAKHQGKDDCCENKFHFLTFFLSFELTDENQPDRLIVFIIIQDRTF